MCMCVFTCMCCCRRGLTVAVKTLVFTVLPHAPMSRRQHRAMTEAAICRTLQHPNIVATYVSVESAGKNRFVLGPLGCMLRTGAACKPPVRVYGCLGCSVRGTRGFVGPFGSPPVTAPAWAMHAHLAPALMCFGVWSVVCGHSTILPVPTKARLDWFDDTPSHLEPQPTTNNNNQQPTTTNFCRPMTCTRSSRCATPTGLTKTPPPTHQVGVCVALRADTHLRVVVRQAPLAAKRLSCQLPQACQQTF